MDPRSEDLSLTAAEQSQTQEPDPERYYPYLDADARFPVEEWELVRESDNETTLDSNGLLDDDEEESPADEDWMFRTSIFERPVCGRFGLLFWAKIQMRSVLFRVCEVFKDRAARARAPKMPSDFPF